MKTKWKVISPYTGIEEDAPANFAGGGNVHGIGVGPYGEPGIDPKKKKKKHTLIDRNGKIDGRTKSYREHRKKLESSRQKRNNARSSKFIENIKKKANERAYGQGYDTAKPMADMSNRNMPKKKKK